jgi:hypothetical protein
LQNLHQSASKIAAPIRFIIYVEGDTAAYMVSFLN